MGYLPIMSYVAAAKGTRWVFNMEWSGSPGRRHHLLCIVHAALDDGDNAEWPDDAQSQRHRVVPSLESSSSRQEAVKRQSLLQGYRGSNRSGVKP